MPAVIGELEQALKHVEYVLRPPGWDHPATTPGQELSPEPTAEEEADEAEQYDQWRTDAEMNNAVLQLLDTVWYVRKLIMYEKIEEGAELPLPEVLNEQVSVKMRQLKERYGADNVGPWD